jgi:hypothetical protein
MANRAELSEAITEILRDTPRPLVEIDMAEAEAVILPASELWRQWRYVRYLRDPGHFHRIERDVLDVNYLYDRPSIVGHGDVDHPLTKFKPEKPTFASYVVSADSVEVLERWYHYDVADRPVERWYHRMGLCGRYGEIRHTPEQDLVGLGLSLKFEALGRELPDDWMRNYEDYLKDCLPQTLHALDCCIPLYADDDRLRILREGIRSDLRLARSEIVRFLRPQPHVTVYEDAHWTHWKDDSEAPEW